LIKERDFSHLNQFPGETGNPFDIALHRLEKLEKLPWPGFLLLLFLLAVLVAIFDLSKGAFLFAFFVVDWILLAFLPKKEISFGPPKPPTLILAILRSISAVFAFPLFLLLQFLGVGLIIYGFWIEPHRLTITYQKLSSPKLSNQRPLRLLHLGDLHIERITAREKKLNQLVEDLKPDLILFSGDILNLSFLNDPQAWNAARQVISEWQAPLGTYLVSGSPAVDLPENLPDLIKDLPLIWMQKSRVTLEFDHQQIDLIGLNCTHRPAQDGPQLASLIPSPPEFFSILLYHSPDLAPVAARLGVDLQLSGHTHGGQIRLPWFGPIFTGSLYGRAFQSGRMKLNSMTLYITRGIGLEGAAAPRVRFLCPPEIILWEISASNPVDASDPKEG
jgi:uncharacterized protein